ncbi:TPA: hypothetical protein PXM28_001523 [Yersinia enterocolitica]|nr:hypothetical protein [Yersinia enterocolitica]
MSEIKQYDTEVRLEAVMGTNHYGVHIHAMTTEDLRSKSDIAVELAWRDLRIEQLIAQLEAARKELSAANEKLSKPILLPRMHVGFDGISTNAGDSVRNRAISDCAEAIRVAGFTVEGE